MARRVRVRCGRRLALACLLLAWRGATAQDLAFVVPASYPETAFMQIVALRRPSWPMILQNIPPATKTLFVPTVSGNDSLVCGWIPVLRNTACFPAALHWLANYWRADRSSYWLQLHSIPNTRASTDAVWRAFGHQLYLGSAAPLELLLAKSSVELLRTPRIAIRQRTLVDTPLAFNTRSSPLVLGELEAPERGQFEYTRGMLHPAADPQMIYPELNALQFIFAHPQLRTLSALLASTCYCPHNWHTVPNATCFIWLCEVIERSVLTMFLPVDEGWEHVPRCTVDFLFEHPDVAAVAIMSWILGPLTLTNNCTTPGGKCAPVGVAAVQPAGFRAGPPAPVSPTSPLEIDERGGGSWFVEGGAARSGRSSPAAAGSYRQRRLSASGQSADGGVPVPLRSDEDAVFPRAQRAAAAPATGDAATPAHGSGAHTPPPSGRRLYLGQVNDSTGDAFDDPVDWTTPVDAYVGIIPFPTYLYTAQLLDLIASGYHDECPQTALGTLSVLWNRSTVDALVAPFLLANRSAYAPLGGAAGGGPAFGRPLLGLFPDDPVYGGRSSSGGGGDWWDAAWSPGHAGGGNHSRHNASCFVAPSANGTWTAAELGAEPSTLVFSHEPLDLGWLAGCDGCPHRRRLLVEAVRASARGGPQQRQLQADAPTAPAGAGAAPPLEGSHQRAPVLSSDGLPTLGAATAGGAAAPLHPSPLPPLSAQPRALNNGAPAPSPTAPPLLVTAVDPHGCMRPDPSNWALLLQPPATAAATGQGEFETLNALLHKIDQPVWPPNVLLTLWEAGLAPFTSSPPAALLPPPMRGCPYSAVRPGSLARLLLALQLAGADQGFAPSASASPSSSPSGTATATTTATATATAMATASDTGTRSDTPTQSASATATSSASEAPTSTPTASATGTASSTGTLTGSPSSSPPGTSTASSTGTPPGTQVPSVTPTSAAASATETASG